MWGTKRKRIRELERRLANMQMANELLGQLNISLIDRWKKTAAEVQDLKQKLAIPLAISTPTRLGPIEVLEIQTDKGIDFQLIGLATIVVSLAAAAALSAVFKKPFKMPAFSELPENPIFRYRYYDWDFNKENTLNEREFKRLLNERGVL